MMVMKAAPATAFHPTTSTSSHQSRPNPRRKLKRDTCVPAEAAEMGFAFPNSTSVKAMPLQPIVNRVIDRPREAKPTIKQSATKSASEVPRVSLDSTDKHQTFTQHSVITSQSTQNNVTERRSLDSLIESTTASHYTHRRERSHFSIPDVIVTSCVEEGEERHYEMRVDPGLRKISFPLIPADAMTGLRLMESTRIQLTAAQRAALDSETTLAKAITEVKSFRAIRGKPKIPAPLAVVGRKSSEGEVKKERPILASIDTNSATPDSKAGKRPRRSSLSGLFSRKDREAAIAPSALPPSPTLQWQNPPSPPPQYSTESSSVPSSFATSNASSRFASSTPSDSSTVPISSVADPLSPATSASPLGSPTIAQTTSLPPLTSTATTSRGKKELRAKAREEQMLIKELEKIDKMVRKHDKEARKAAASKGAESPTIDSNTSNNEGKAKRALRRMSVFRQSTAPAHKSTGKTAPPLPSYVKVSARAMAEAEMQRSMERQRAKSGPANNLTRDRRNSGDESVNASPDLSWSGEVWTDLPSPVDEQLPSLTLCSPVRARTRTDRVEDTSSPSIKRTASIQRRGSNSQHVISSKLASRRVSSRRGSRDVTNSTKRYSGLRTSFGLTLDLSGATDMEWEDSYNLLAKENLAFRNSTATEVSSDKGSTLLESLYKDIEDMETNFQLERKVLSRKSQVHAQSNDIVDSSSTWRSLPSYSATRPLKECTAAYCPSSQVKAPERPAHLARPLAVQRADTLPSPQAKEEAEMDSLLSKSSSAPNFF